jgi:hypothetical protein
MTTNTTNDGVDVSSSAAIEHPIADLPPLADAAPPVAAEPDLESRLRHRRAALIDQLGALRGDVRPESVESRLKLKAKLSELAHIVKWGVVGSYASLAAPLTNKLEEWLTESAGQLRPRPERK